MKFRGLPAEQEGITMPPANPLLGRAIATVAAIAALTAFCLAIIVVRSRNSSRQADNEVRLAFSAPKAVLDQASKREQQRDRVLSKNLAQISKAERAAKNPADIAKRLPAAFGPLPHALSVSLAPRDSGSDAPEPPAIITVPQEDLSDERTKVSALKIERDAAVKAARGGGFWSRFRTGLKWFAIGGAIGALAASAVHR